MTLARRLLAAAGGGASITVPVVYDTPYSLGVTGFWNNIAGPRAAYSGGKTFVAYSDSSNVLYAARVDNATKAADQTHTVGTADASPDGAIHNSPCLLVRASDSKILFAASSDAPAEAAGAFWLSTSASDVSAFGSATLLGAVTSPTYPNLEQLTGVSGSPVYYFTRVYDGTTFHTGYYKSTDGGATWSAFQSLVSPTAATNAQYHSIGSDGSTRIDIFTTDTNRTVAHPSSVYHMYLDGTSGNVYKTDGTLIGAASSGPYVATSGTLVQDASLGRCWTDGWSYTAGRPACLVKYDPSNAGTTTKARLAQWTGSAWSVTDIADNGGTIGGNVFIASGAIDKANPYRVWLPVKTGSHFEMFLYTSGTSGATWTATQLTSGSTHDHAMPDSVLRGAAGCRAVWGYGDYTSDSSFTFTVYGGG